MKPIDKSKISIHAPHEGSDMWELFPPPEPSTISIHAPHEGSDGKHQQKGCALFVAYAIYSLEEGHFRKFCVIT